MLFLKYLSLGVLGCFLGALGKVYMDRYGDREYLEYLTLMIVALSAKNFLFRITNIWDSMVNVSLSACVSWLSFSFGYCLMLYVAMSARTESLPAVSSDNEIAASRNTAESTGTIVMLSLFLSACLLVIAVVSLLIRQLY